MQLEQAVFTSRATSRALGYQLVARSPGIAEEDARALSSWGPSHDALNESATESGSINFFPLPSGARCLSQTMLAGAEYSGRGGPLVYTQILVVDRGGLGRFANNPLALLTAATARGAIAIRDDLPAQLEPLTLAGRASAFDRETVEQVVAKRGPAWLARLVEAVVSYQPLGILGGGVPRSTLGAVFNCLPVSCRPGLSFTTGLRFTPRRPFRVHFLHDLTEGRRLARAYDLSLFLALDERATEQLPERGWAGFLGQVLAEGEWDLLARVVAHPLPGGRGWDGLDEWGQVLRQHGLPDDDEPAQPAWQPRLVAADAGGEDEDSVAAGRAGSGHRRADAPHRRRPAAEDPLTQATRVLAELATDPADVLGAECPGATRSLEQLDDVVFEAIAGKSTALDRLKTLWPEVLTRLGPELVEESKLQYIRHALHVWRECLQGEEVEQPGRALQALEVLTVIFGEGPRADTTG